MRQTILMVENDPISAERQEAILSGFGYRVILADSGEKAIELVRENENIHLVIIAIELGTGTDGIETSRKILAVRRLPIVFLTTHDEQEIVEKVRHVTCYGLILKDSGNFVLRSSIEMALSLFAAHNLAQSKIEELWDAQVSLKKMDMELREAQRIAQIGNWYWDAKTDVITGSDVLFQIFGIESGVQFFPEFKKQRGVCYPEDSWHLVDAAYRKSLLTGNGFELETQAIRGNDLVWISIRGEAVKGSGGRVIGLRGTVQSISERKLAELAAKQEQDVTEAVIESLPGAFYVLDARGRFVRWNAFERDEVLGLPDGQIAGKNAMETIHPDDRALLMSKIETVLRTGIDDSSEGRVLLRGGPDFRWFLLTGRRLVIEGKPFLVGTGIDITERKRIDEELQFRNILLSTQQETSLDGILVVDEQARILSYNRRFVEMWRLPPELVEAGVDETVLQFVADQLADPQAFYRRVRFLYENKHQTSREELFMTDGRVFDRYSVPIFGPKGRYYGRVWYFRDVTERVRAEVATIESQQMLKTVLDAIPVRVFWKDRELKYLGCNRRFAQDAGFADPRDLVGKDDFQMAWCDQADQYRADDRKVLRSGIPVMDYEEPQTTPAGKTIWLKTSKIPLKNANDEIIGILGTYEDITEHKQAFDDVRKSVERLREAQRLAHIGSWKWVMASDSVEWSQELFHITGLNPELPAPCFAKMAFCYSPESWERLNLAVEKTLQTGEPYELDLVMIRPDGTTRFTSTRGGVDRDVNGRIVGLHGTVQDISARKHAEEQILATHERYRTLFEGTAEGILIVEVVTRRFKYANPAICRMLGYSQNELVGMSVEDIHPRPALEMVIAEFETPSQGERAQVTDLPCRRKNGDIIYVNIASSMVTIDGELCRLGFFTDITEQKRADEERRDLEMQVIQTQKLESIGRLAGGVAHDFNNMLQAIMGFVDLALDQLDSTDPIYADLKEVVQVAERATNLTRQLLAFARKQAIAPELLDLNDVGSGMLKMLQRLIGEDIQLIWKPWSNLWNVKVDPSQIDQILANLCVNARDAIEDVGTITIETFNRELGKSDCADRAGFVPGEYVVLSVSDNGCGIEPEILTHIFEPFFTTKAVGEGTGLGLSTVYGIVKQNNGFIGISSKVGKGTTFDIYLPRYDQAPVVDSMASKEKEALVGTETILFVEDDAAVLKVGKRILENFGYHVLAAGSADEAIRLSRDYDGFIHLLISDVVMPMMNGRDLAEQLSASRPGLKRLFMSGYTAEVITHRGVLDDGLCFIHKPYSPKALATKIREVLQD